MTVVAESCEVGVGGLLGVQAGDISNRLSDTSVAIIRGCLPGIVVGKQLWMV